MSQLDSLHKVPLENVLFVGQLAGETFITVIDKSGRMIGFSMEFMENGSLEQSLLMTCRKVLSVLFAHPSPVVNNDRICSWFFQLCRGVKALHDVNLIHKDVNPQNILVTNGFKCLKLKPSMTISTDQQNVSVQHWFNRVRYSAREALQKMLFTKQSDICSLGLVLFSMVTKTYPFNVESNDLRELYKFTIRNNDLRELAKLVTEDNVLKTIEDTGTDWSSLILWCSNSDPRLRPTVEELLEKENYEVKGDIEPADPTLSQDEQKLDYVGLEPTTSTDELISHVKTLTPILHEEVKKPGIAMKPTDFRELLPVPRRAVVDLLIKQKEWPVLKEFISTESRKAQQAFEVFMRSVDKSDHASIRSPQLPSEKTAVELLQLEVANETDNAKKGDTKDDSKLTTSDITDLHIAVRQGDEKLAQSLIDKGVDVNGTEGKSNSTPLHYAAQNGQVNMVKLLLQHGAIVDSEDNDHITPLHFAARQGDNLMVGMLITAGSSVSSKDKYGRTPLHFAAENNHIECARTLLNHRAPIDAATNFGSTSLYFAVRCGHEQMVKLLLDENADFNACNCNGRAPLHYACSKDMIKVVELLLQYKATIEVSDKEGVSPLQVACSEGAINCVTYLLECGANPNTRTNNGLTALHFATRANSADVVIVLIQYGANVDARCTFLESALHIASFNGKVDIVTLLLQAGANPNSETTDNETPLQFARANGHNEVTAILVNHGAR